MHIDEWNEDFLSRFEAERYVAMLKNASVQTAMIYANSSVGLCNWPTKTGRMHKNLHGKDILGEMLDRCRAEGITTVVYYSAIFNNWAYKEYPEWRTVDLEGGHSRDEGKTPLATNRYGLCCPNSRPHRDFIKAQLTELIDGYSFNGVYLDMSFWPVVCYCENCRRRYADEIGGSIPEKIDWEDRDWVDFQSRRSSWINEYSFELTNHIKDRDDSLSVQHNYAPALYSWLLSIDDVSSDAHDYLGGDRFDGYVDQSFVCKLYYSLAKNVPVEYQSSRCYPDLGEHTTIKSTDMLRLHAYLSLAHNAAFLFIDAIDPDGSLDSLVYERMGEVFRESQRFESYLGGTFVQDVAIYFSFNSRRDLSRNGAPAQLYVGDVLEEDILPLEAARDVTAALKEGHVPFGVIARKNIDSLGRYRTVVLSAIDLFDREEVAAFARYVEEGGTLYVSGAGAAKYLGTLLGVEYHGQTVANETYMSPTDDGRAIFGGANVGAAFSIKGSQAVVDDAGGGTALATISLPFTDPTDGSTFASIYSNPPGVHTDSPAILRKRVGNGQIVWSAFPIERINNEPHRSIFLSLLRSLRPDEYSFSSDAPGDVEITLFHQPDKSRSILSLVNVQERRLILPIRNFRVDVRTGGNSIQRVWLPPDGGELDYSVDGDRLRIEMEQLDIYKMVSVEYA